MDLVYISVDFCSFWTASAESRKRSSERAIGSVRQSAQWITFRHNNAIIKKETFLAWSKYNSYTEVEIDNTPKNWHATSNPFRGHSCQRIEAIEYRFQKCVRDTFRRWDNQINFHWLYSFRKNARKKKAWNGRNFQSFGCCLKNIFCSVWFFFKFVIIVLYPKLDIIFLLRFFRVQSLCFQFLRIFFSVNRLFEIYPKIILLALFAKVRYILWHIILHALFSKVRYIHENSCSDIQL